MIIKNVKRIITIAKEFDFNILEATLLTLEETDKILPKRLLPYNNWWWLKTPSCYSCHVVCVSSSGFTVYPGNIVDFANNVVRPVLVISNLESSGLKIGDTFEFGGQKFEIISDDKAFCLGDIGTCVFRKDNEAPDANVYEKSDIKKYIDEWFDWNKE